MQLYSTKNKSITVSLKEAVFKGLPSDNGLFMPSYIPVLPFSFFENIDQYSFQEIAIEVCKALIGEDVPEEEIKKIIDDVIEYFVHPVHFFCYQGVQLSKCFHRFGAFYMNSFVLLNYHSEYFLSALSRKFEEVSTSFNFFQVYCVCTWNDIFSRLNCTSVDISNN